MKRKIIPYNPKLKLLARELRNNSTKSEIILWGKLKGKQCYGYDFHRQKPIDNYILTRCAFWLFKLNATSVRVIFDKKLYRELLFFNKISILDTNFKPKKA